MHIQCYNRLQPCVACVLLADPDFNWINTFPLNASSFPTLNWIQHNYAHRGLFVCIAVCITEACATGRDHVKSNCINSLPNVNLLLHDKNIYVHYIHIIHKNFTYLLMHIYIIILYVLTHIYVHTSIVITHIISWHIAVSYYYICTVLCIKMFAN